jgi:BirA family transcriptional regulator, biotin operon repressor / biotin---[acetyl-CoA-carboxylase] ligase
MKTSSTHLYSQHPSVCLESIDSTNEEAKRRFQAGEIQSLFSILAFHQTSGKGTQGREWVSPSNAGVYLSIVHPKPPEIAFPLTPEFTLAAGLGSLQALNHLFEAQLHSPLCLKPINDIYAGGKKLGGILTESIIQDGEIKAIITGIGINILDLPRLETATSLEALMPGAFWQKQTPQALCTELAQHLVSHVDCAYQLLLQEGPEVIRKHWQQTQCPEWTLKSELLNELS